MTNERCKIFWNFPFHTTVQVSANKPDMALIDFTAKKMHVLEMSCPGETNIASKENEKIDKYRDLLFQLKLTYSEYTLTFIPLIIGVLGGMRPTITENLKKIKCITSKKAEILTSEMQKYVLLGSMHLLRAHEASRPTTSG